MGLKPIFVAYHGGFRRCERCWRATVVNAGQASNASLNGHIEACLGHPKVLAKTDPIHLGHIYKVVNGGE